jgi:hypothetical protein
VNFCETTQGYVPEDGSTLHQDQVYSLLHSFLFPLFLVILGVLDWTNRGTQRWPANDKSGDSYMRYTEIECLNNLHRNVQWLIFYNGPVENIWTQYFKFPLFTYVQIILHASHNQNEWKSTCNSNSYFSESTEVLDTLIKKLTYWGLPLPPPMLCMDMMMQ